MTNSLPKAVVFDWDNTLIDSWVIIHHALSVTFQEMGREPWTLDEAKDRVRASARDSFPKIFGDDTDIALKIFYDTYQANHLDVLTPLAGAKELVDHLLAKSVYLSIVSNKQGDILRKEVEHLGWSPLFQNIVGANDGPRDKPDPIVMDLGLKGSDLKVDQNIWFVGDTDIDLQCAHNSQCTPVLIRPHSPEEGEFNGCEPSHYFTSCRDMISYLS